MAPQFGPFAGFFFWVDCSTEERSTKGLPTAFGRNGMFIAASTRHCADQRLRAVSSSISVGESQVVLASLSATAHLLSQHRSK